MIIEALGPSPLQGRAEVAGIDLRVPGMPRPSVATIARAALQCCRQGIGQVSVARSVQSEHAMPLCNSRFFGSLFAT
jgi:hypothetical protein